MSKSLSLHSDRNEYFDILKGILMLLVILGHLPSVAIQESPLRVFLYYFHMPLFLGVTGYFITHHVVKMSVIDLALKYWHRLAVPFILSYIVTMYYRFGLWGGVFEPHWLIYPFSVFWYIPAMILSIFYLRILSWLTQYRATMILGLVLLGAFLCVLPVTALYPEWNHFHRILYFMGDVRYYSMFTFFLLGYLLRRYPQYQYRFVKTMMVMGILGISTLVVSFDSAPLELIVRTVGRMMTNYALIYLSIALCTYLKDRTPSSGSIHGRSVGWPCELLRSIGENSLPIFLWHMIPIFIAQDLTVKESWVYYVCAAMGCAMIVWIFLKLRHKSPIIDRLFYGVR